MFNQISSVAAVLLMTAALALPESLQLRDGRLYRAGDALTAQVVVGYQRENLLGDLDWRLPSLARGTIGDRTGVLPVLLVSAFNDEGPFADQFGYARFLLTDANLSYSRGYLQAWVNQTGGGVHLYLWELETDGVLRGDDRRAHIARCLALIWDMPAFLCMGEEYNEGVENLLADFDLVETELARMQAARGSTWRPLLTVHNLVNGDGSPRTAIMHDPRVIARADVAAIQTTMNISDSWTAELRERGWRGVLSSEITPYNVGIPIGGNGPLMMVEWLRRSVMNGGIGAELYAGYDNSPLYERPVRGCSDLVCPDFALYLPHISAAATEAQWWSFILSDANADQVLDVSDLIRRNRP